MSKSDSSVTIGAVTNSTFAIGDGAVVIGGQVADPGDDSAEDDE